MLLISSTCVLHLLKTVEIDLLLWSHLQFVGCNFSQYDVLRYECAEINVWLIKQKICLILSLSFSISQQLRQRHPIIVFEGSLGWQLPQIEGIVIIEIPYTLLSKSTDIKVFI